MVSGFGGVGAGVHQEWIDATQGDWPAVWQVVGGDRQGWAGERGVRVGRVAGLVGCRCSGLSGLVSTGLGRVKVLLGSFLGGLPSGGVIVCGQRCYVGSVDCLGCTGGRLNSGDWAQSAKGHERVCDNQRLRQELFLPPTRLRRCSRVPRHAPRSILSAPASHYQPCRDPHF